jgi:alpha-glucoside transport system permease protein
MSATTGTGANPFADDQMLAAAIEGVDPTSHKANSVGRRASKALSTRIGKIIVVVLAVTWTIPTFGVLVSSFRPENDVKTNGWWNFFTDPAVTLDNYRAVLSSGSGGDNLTKYFMNSVIITVPSVALSIGLALLAAYAFSWIEFRGRDWMFVATVALLMVPLQMSLVPILQLFSGGAHIGTVTIFPDLNLTGKYLGVWIAHTIFGMPFCVFILKNFIGGLPRDIVEAAKIDGAGHLTIFARLIVPLSVPAIASLTIFQFMWIWNDYLIALIYAGQDKAPITRQLATLTGTRGQSWHLLTAAGMVSMIVPIAVFFALQRYFVRGLLAGAVKG